MSNIDRAADVIARCWPNGRGVRKDDSQELARALAEAGLLAPDEAARIVPALLAAADHATQGEK